MLADPVDDVHGAGAAVEVKQKEMSLKNTVEKEMSHRELTRTEEDHTRR